MNYYYQDECKCGHEKDSHYDKKENCLAMHCDCSRFRKVGTPDTIPPPPPPETEPTLPDDQLTWADLKNNWPF